MTLIVILDDATGEIYYAQLTEEESTLTVMAGLKEVIAQQVGLDQKPESIGPLFKKRGKRRL